MQTTGHNLSLIEAASDVLESMCFLGVVGASDDPATPAEDSILCRLEFSGDGRGVFGLATSPCLAAVIAENFLGEPAKEISRMQMEEVLCELSNMICGSFLSRLRADSIFDLTHPRCEPVGALLLAEIAKSSTAQALDLDEGRLFLWLETTV